MDVHIWDVPESDYQEWAAFTGSHLGGYDGYRGWVRSAITNAVFRGDTVRMVPLSVGQMRDKLRAAGLENTTQNRAMVLAIESG